MTQNAQKWHETRSNDAKHTGNDSKHTQTTGNDTKCKVMTENTQTPPFWKFPFWTNFFRALSILIFRGTFLGPSTYRYNFLSWPPSPPLPRAVRTFALVLSGVVSEVSSWKAPFWKAPFNQCLPGLPASADDLPSGVPNTLREFNLKARNSHGFKPSPTQPGRRLVPASQSFYLSFFFDVCVLIWLKVCTTPCDI